MISTWPVRLMSIMVWSGITMGCVSIEEQRRSMVRHCEVLGLERNSTEFSNCIAQLDRQNGISQQCIGAFRYGVPYTYGRCMSERGGTRLRR